MDIGTAKPTRRAGRGPPPPDRPGRPERGVHVSRWFGDAARRRWPTSRPRPPGRARRRDRPVLPRRGRRPRDPARPVSRGARPSSKPSPTRAALHAGCEALDPVAAARMEPTNRRRIVRALEVTLGAVAASRRSGPGWRPIPTSTIAPGRALAASSRDELDQRIAGAPATSWRPASSTRSGAWRPPRAACRAPPARPSATASCSRTCEGGRPGGGGRTVADPPHPRVRAPPGRVVRRRDPRITWIERRAQSTRRDTLARLGD